MITYELAVKLKEAGFPQTGYGEGESCSYLPVGKERKMENIISVYLPTLSDLIEACGDEFGHLESVSDETGHKNIGFVCSGKGMSIPKDFSQTPEEAVTTLYLKLHDKKS